MVLLLSNHCERTSDQLYLDVLTLAGFFKNPTSHPGGNLYARTACRLLAVYQTSGKANRKHLLNFSQ